MATIISTLHPAAALQVHILAAAQGVPLVFTTDHNEWSAHWQGERDPFEFLVYAVRGIPMPVKPEDICTHISLPKLRSPFAYAVALHELGHLYHRTSDELTAWAFAYEHALFWCPMMTKCVLAALITYRRQYSAERIAAFVTALKEK